jgi:hypothetical protein
MTILWSNNASTTISGSITSAATSVALAAGTGALFPNPTGGNFYVATFYDQATKTVNEIVHVTAMVGDVATIQRAQESTTARAWNAGDIFANLVTAGTLNNFVQAGTGPANTSIVYVGTDTSTTPGLIIATTNPVPASLAIGMLFNIWVKNTTPGTTMMQLNGGASIEAVRTDGSHMIAGNIVAGEEYTFIYNGVNFTSAIQAIPITPPQNVFYVNTTGNDNNSGLANTSTQAFATVYGAIAAIQSRYISQTAVTIRVADGTYIGGFQSSVGYIASWIIIGNTANPGNVIIDATTLSPPAGAAPGNGCAVVGGSVMSVSGFTFKSYYCNAAAGTGSTLTLSSCHYTPCVATTQGVLASFGGKLVLNGAHQYSSGGTVPACLFLASDGNVSISYYGAYTNNPTTFNFVGTPTFGMGTAVGEVNGVVMWDSTAITWSGAVPNCPKYVAELGGGIWDGDANPNSMPGSSAGLVYSPGWVA